MKKTIKLMQYSNASVARGYNKRITIKKHKFEDVEAVNIQFVRPLTREQREEVGTLSESELENLNIYGMRVMVNEISLSTEGIEMLEIAIRDFLSRQLHFLNKEQP
jgi:hypothetical protein